MGALPCRASETVQASTTQTSRDKLSFWCIARGELLPCSVGQRPCGSSFRPGSNGKIAVADRVDSLAGLTASKTPALDRVAMIAATGIIAGVPRTPVCAQETSRKARAGTTCSVCRASEASRRVRAGTGHCLGVAGWVCRPASRCAAGAHRRCWCPRAARRMSAASRAHLSPPAVASDRHERPAARGHLAGPALVDGCCRAASRPRRGENE